MWQTKLCRPLLKFQSRTTTPWQLPYDGNPTIPLEHMQTTPCAFRNLSAEIESKHPNASFAIHANPWYYQLCITLQQNSMAIMPATMNPHWWSINWPSTVDWILKGSHLLPFYHPTTLPIQETLHQLIQQTSLVQMTPNMIEQQALANTNTSKPAPIATPHGSSLSHHCTSTSMHSWPEHGPAMVDASGPSLPPQQQQNHYDNDHNT